MGKRKKFEDTKDYKLILEAKQVIDQYTTILTLRQIYYRLVAKLILMNTLSKYKGLSAALVKGRKKGIISYDSMEDRTRSIVANQGYYTTPEETLENYITWVLDAYKDYKIPRTYSQKHVVIVLLEKEALARIFGDVCEKLNAYLVVCKGYNSLSQLHELVVKLKYESKIIHVVEYSDHDPSGEDITRNFRSQIVELGAKIESFERIALTKEQIDKYNLPYAPLKTSDSKAKNWTDVKGVVELDALDPPILEKLISDSILQYFDEDIFQEDMKLQKEERSKLKIKCLKIKEALENIGIKMDKS